MGRPRNAINPVTKIDKTNPPQGGSGVPVSKSEIKRIKVQKESELQPVRLTVQENLRPITKQDLIKAMNYFGFNWPDLKDFTILKENIEFETLSGYRKSIELKYLGD